MPLPPHTYKKDFLEDPVELRIPQHEDEKKLHIFQTSENTRMLHALQNWDWFVRDKPKLLQYLAEVTQRPIAMLRMDSGWKHRLKMENIEALESIKTNALRFRSSADYVKGEARRAPKWWPHGVEDHNESEEETMTEEAEEAIEFIDKSIDLRDPPPPKPIGPAASFTRTNLLFCIKAGEIVERTLTIKNKGNVALFYSWERRPMQPLVLLGRKKDGQRFFTLMGGTGSILPGQFKKFFFKFYSNQVGTHMENWVCRLYPKPNARVEPLKLKGVTLYDDNKLRWRTQLERILDYREMMRGIGEALHDVMETSAVLSRPTTELRDKEYIHSAGAYNFMRRNLRLNPPLYFTPSSFKKLKTFAEIVMPDGDTLHPFASKIQAPQLEVSQTTQTNQTQPEAVNKESGKEDEKAKKKKKDTIQFMENMATNMSPLETRATETLGDDKKTKGSFGDKKEMKEKKDKKQMSRVVEEKLAKRRKDTSTSKEDINVFPPQIDESDLRPNILINPCPIDREYMFCRPCFDTYVPPSIPPPPPPPTAWAGSVASILLAIKACPDKKQRRALKLEMRNLLEEASIPPHQTSLLLMAMYKTLHQISSDFEHIMETVTEETGRPVAEQLLRIYYEQMEKEQAISEEAERLREVQGDGGQGWPFDEDDTDSAILADEMRTEIKKQQAHDVVHYLMRWTHVLTEARGIVKYGAGEFQEQVEKDQRTVALLIEEKLHELSSFGLDDDACWKAFDLERKKQVLQEEFTQLPPCQLPNP